MSDFFKKFLLEDPRRFGPSGHFAALAAFGKHPGWDDHVEDLGLETESLNLAKTVLYVNGIGGQIDSGVWEKLDASQQVPFFKHVFVWQRSGQILVGRMWSSSDGKGRKRYPMVVCFHFIGVTLGWALKQALPALADLEEGCLKTTSAADVRNLLSRKRTALREAIQSTDAKGEYAPVSPEALHKILQPANAEGFLRVLYQIQSQLGGFGPGVFGVRTTPASARAQQVRVPMAAETAEQALRFWTRFFLVYIDSSVPLLLSLPLEADWVDVTVGEPESHEMFCLRANPKAVPKVSEVPYKLDDAFRAKAAAFLEGFQRGETSKIDLQPAVAPVADAIAPAKGGWLKWLGVGAVVILGVVAALLVLSQKANPGPETNRTETQSKMAKPASAPGVADLAKAEQERAKSKMDAQAEADRLAQEKKKSDAIAAAAKLKADTEAAAKAKERGIAEAAAKEKERQLAEAAAKEKERQIAQAAAREKERQLAEAAAIEKQRQAAEAARLAEEQQAALQKEALERQRKETEIAAAEKSGQAQPQTKIESVAVGPGSPPVAAASDTKPAGTAPAPAGWVSQEMTNSIGMVLVALPSGIWVGKYEVTQAEYLKVMGTNPSKFVEERQPVEKVSWNDAVEFALKLTQMERTTLPAGKVYSLPTENQWNEFSGGQKFEDVRVASGVAPAVVGQSGPPNKFGLFDVLGNVWEWCLDDRPSGTKLLKGGSYDGKPFYNRQLSPETTSVSCGFRCILAPQ